MRTSSIIMVHAFMTVDAMSTADLSTHSPRPWPPTSRESAIFHSAFPRQDQQSLQLVEDICNFVAGEVDENR